MLPDYDRTVSLCRRRARHAPAQASGGYVRVALTNANTGSSRRSRRRTTSPSRCPCRSAATTGWCSPASAPTPTRRSRTPKKLWVTAISPGGTPGTDPSHPPFTLVNQAIVAPQQSQRAYWALAPCQGMRARAARRTTTAATAAACRRPRRIPSRPLVCGTAEPGCVANGCAVRGRSEPGLLQRRPGRPVHRHAERLWYV